MSLWSRQRKDGTLVYYYKFRWRKRTYQGYIGPVSKTTAKRVELQKKVEGAEGSYQVAARAPAPTFDAFAPRCLAWYATGHRPGSYDRYEARLRLHLLPYLGPLRLDQCTTAVVDEYRTVRHAEGASASSLNGELRVLNQMARKAREWGLIGSEHPRALAGCQRKRRRFAC